MSRDCNPSAWLQSLSPLAPSWDARSIVVGRLLGTENREERALYCCYLEASEYCGGDIWYLGKQRYSHNRKPQKVANGWTLCPATMVGPPLGHWASLCRLQRCRHCPDTRRQTHDPHQNTPRTPSATMLTGEQIETALPSRLLPSLSSVFSNA